MTPAGGAITRRVGSLDWTLIAAALEERGCATIGTLLTPRECETLRGHYADDTRFRSRVVMERHGFGKGEYKYFTYPLPPPVAALRSALYGRLAHVANRWERPAATTPRYPPTLADFTLRCRGVGQSRATPLLLKYGPGDYNCLHQDLYGDTTFPLQATFLLSRPGEDFEGGEFVLVEQRPRMQSRAEVVSLRQGDGVIFAVNRRPVEGKRGTYQVAMRHGVSRLRSGQRFTLGVIFHEAR